MAKRCGIPPGVFPLQTGISSQRHDLWREAGEIFLVAAEKTSHTNIFTVSLRRSNEQPIDRSGVASLVDVFTAADREAADL